MPTIAPARAAESPPLSQAPAGVVRPLTGAPQTAIFDGRTAQLVIAGPGRTSASSSSLTLLGFQQTSQRVVDLPGPATALAGDNDGTAYLSGRGGYFVVDLSAGRATRVSVRDADNVDFTAITRRSDGTLVLGAADGTLYTLKPGATDVARMSVHAHIDSLAAQGNTVAVLDRGQTSVITVGADGKIGQSLRAGQGATSMTADPAGRLLVADTRGGQLLVFGVDPLILRQAYPVPGIPVRRGRITWAGLGFADRGEYRYWLRSVNRNTTGKGTVPNRAATRHARLRRWRGHVVCRCRAQAGACRSSNTRRQAHVDGGTARQTADGLGHRIVRRVRMGAVASATRGNQAQRIDAAVHRSGVPRLGIDPGTALHRRK